MKHLIILLVCIIFMVNEGISQCPPACTALFNKILKSESEAEMKEFENSNLCKDCSRQLAEIKLIRERKSTKETANKFRIKLNNFGCECADFQVSEDEKKNFSDLIVTYKNNCFNEKVKKIDAYINDNKIGEARSLLHKSECWKTDDAVFIQVEADIGLTEIQKKQKDKQYIESMTIVTLLQTKENYLRPEQKERLHNLSIKAKNYIVNDIEMIYIPSGNNQKGFWISKYPISRKQYSDIVKPETLPIKPFGISSIEWNDSLPITNITQKDVTNFFQIISKNTHIYQLPTEDHWNTAILDNDIDTYNIGQVKIARTKFSELDYIGIVWEMLYDNTSSTMFTAKGGSFFENGFTKEKKIFGRNQFDIGFRIVRIEQ